MQAFSPAQIADLTQLLMQISDNSVMETQSAAPDSNLRDTGRLLDRVRWEQRNRKRRSELLGVSQDIFADPAWDILIELFAAELTGQKMNASVVGLDADIPQSTALRWLNMLERMGLVRRRKDDFDKRRQWVALTNNAYAALQRYFL